MARHSLLAVLAVLVTSRADAQLETFLSESDVAAYMKLATEATKSSSAEEIYFGTKLSLSLGGDVGAMCSHADKVLKQAPGDITVVGFAGAALKAAGCRVELDDAATEAATATIKQNLGAPHFTPKFLSVLGAASLGLGLDASDIEKGVKRLSKFKDEEGLFKEDQLDRRGSSDRTYLMLELIGATGVESKGTKLTLEKAGNLLPGVSVDGEGSVDASLVSALAAASKEPLQLSAAQLAAIASQLLRLKSASSSVSAAYKVYAGLKLLAGFNDAPLAVLLRKPTLKSKDTLRLDVRTVLGDPVSDAAVTISRLSVPSKKKELDNYKDMALQSSALGGYEGTLELEPGLYNLALIVSVEGGLTTTVDRSVVIKTTSRVENISVTLSPSRDAADGKSYAVSSGKQLPDGLQASSSDGEVVIVKFSVPCPSPPHQAFIRFTHVESGVDTYFPGDRAADGDGWAFTAIIPLADNVGTFLHKSGPYKVSLLVGDVVLQSSLDVMLGTVRLDLPPKAKTQHPLYARPLLWDSDNAQAPLPTIEHQFRQPEKRPTPVVPLFFTLVILLLLLAFVGLLPFAGANLKGLPGGIGFVWSVAFFGCLLCFLLFFTAYFIQMKMMTLLRYLLFLSVATTAVGHKAFSASISARAKRKVTRDCPRL